MVKPRSTPLLLAGLALVAAFILAVAALRRPATEPAARFVGTTACAGCHQQAFDAWQHSHHRHAMEPAAADSVLGNFNDATFDYAGTTSRFFQRDGRYFVETDNAQGALQTFRVAWTFGWYPLQQYLVEFPDGRLQALSISWDSRPASEGGQRWYHLYPDERVTHEDPLHWTGSYQNWNSRCAACHSTGLVKAYDKVQDRYATRWQEANVGCEACHGPGSRHLDWAGGDRDLDNKGLATNVGRVWEPVGGQRDIPPATDTMSGQLQVCGACHSRRTELGNPDVTASFHDQYALSPLLEGLYFADGQIRDEVYEVGSFMQSRMHQNQVSCTNCHEPHGGQLRATGNALCLQCHEPRRFQDRSHHFHQENSAGAQCVNCHMPERTYMGVDRRRDHSFRVPDPIASIQLGVPNACTQCHADRDDRWAARVVTQQRGRTTPWHPHAQLLADARRDSAAVLPDLLAYAMDAGRPAILRAVAVLESGRFASDQQLAGVTAALASADPLLRMGAASALTGLDSQQRLTRLAPLVEDPVKSVRMTAARHLIDVRPAQVPEAQRHTLVRLFDEYRASLDFNADMPESMNELALFHAAQGDLPAAEQSLQQALKLAPRFLPSMLNLADLHRSRDRDDLGEPLLREAMRVYPESGDVRHALGLLYVRTGRTPQSVELFREASRLAPGNAQYALVHAVSLYETGKPAEAVAVLESATHRFPDNVAIRDALSGYRSGAPAD